MVGKYHGLNLSLDYLRLRFPASVFGTKLSSVVGICTDSGMLTRAVRLELDELSKLQTPCILHWEMGHYVVLAESTKDGAWVHDPSIGRVFVSRTELGRLFTGVALELSRRVDFIARNESPVSAKFNWLKFATAVQGFRGALVRSFGLAVLLEVLSLAQPVITQVIVDQSATNSDSALVVSLAIALTTLSLSALVFGAARTWVIGTIQGRLFLSSSSNVFAHLLQLPMSFFERRRLGDVVSRFNTIASIQKILSTRLVEVVLDGLMSILTLTALFVYCRLAAVIALFALFGQIIVKVIGYPSFAERSAKTLMIGARQQNRVVESVRLVHTIRTSNAQSRVLSRYVDLGVSAFDADMDVQRYEILLNFFSSLISNVERIVIMAVGAFLVGNHAFTVGALVATLYISLQFSTRSRNLMEYLFQLRLLKLQQGRLADIVNARPEPNFSSRYIGHPEGHGLSLNNVSFRYNQNDRWILKGLTMEIQEGEFVAIVGPSGIGKSTLVNIIMGVLSPSMGEVVIGNVDLENFGKSNYREILGVALQDAGIFSGTIAENISMFDEAATYEQIETAAKLACVHDEILTKPMGYNTQLGGIESHLSAGQRQKIILARALYRQPKILVLDEATCHMDVHTEKKILENIAALNITRIMVTHRHGAALYADRIYDVARGEYWPKEDRAALRNETAVMAR
jgi:ATP-binding cassette subfamily B protein RaxB